MPEWQYLWVVLENGCVVRVNDEAWTGADLETEPHLFLENAGIMGWELIQIQMGPETGYMVLKKLKE